MPRTASTPERARLQPRLSPALAAAIRERAASQGISVNSFIELALQHAVDDRYLHLLTTSARNSLIASLLLQSLLPRFVDGDTSGALAAISKACNTLIGDPPPWPDSIPRGGPSDSGDFTSRIWDLCQTYATDHFNLKLRVPNSRQS